ncbi:MAG: hypothetical protein ACKOAD_04385 [Gammaproteobacteria bacterium]
MVNKDNEFGKYLESKYPQKMKGLKGMCQAISKFIGLCKDYMLGKKEKIKQTKNLNALIDSDFEQQRLLISNVFIKHGQKAFENQATRNASKPSPSQK